MADAVDEVAATSCGALHVAGYRTWRRATVQTAEPRAEASLLHRGDDRQHHPEGDDDEDEELEKLASPFATLAGASSSGDSPLGVARVGPEINGRDRLHNRNGLFPTG